MKKLKRGRKKINEMKVFIILDSSSGFKMNAKLKKKLSWRI